MKAAIRVCLCLACWGPGLGFAQAVANAGPAAAAVQAQVVDRLMRDSAIDAALASLPEQVNEGLRQAQAQGAGLPAQVVQAMGEAAAQAYAFAPLRAELRQRLVDALTPDELASWDVFYQTPLGRKLAEADAQATQPDSQVALMQAAPAVLEKLSTDPGRMALLQSWLQASQGVQRATEFALHFTLALEWGFVSTMPDSPDKPSHAEVRDQIYQQRFALQAQMAQLVLAQAAFSYQGLSNAELAALLAQANSAAGQALYRDFGLQFFAVLAQRSELLGQLVGQRLLSRPA